MKYFPVHFGKNHKKINLRLFEKYFITFCIVIIIPTIITSIIIYSICIKIVKDMENTSNNRILTNVSKMVDDKLLEINQAVYNLSRSDNIYQLFSNQDSYDKQNIILTTAEILKEFSKLYTSVNYIDDIYLARIRYTHYEGQGTAGAIPASA